MKKLIAIVLCVTIGLSLISCGKKEPVKEELKEQIEDTLTVGFIYLHDENSSYDRNFMNAAKAACEANGVEYLEKVGIPETNECYEAAADLVDRGADIVFADSFGHESFIIQAAQEFPEVQFCHATGTMAHTQNLSNYHNAFASIYEGRYLAGVAAGLKLEEIIGTDPSIEPKVGYVGAFTYAEVISGYTAWFLGVRSIVPEATMEVQFTGSWYDEALEKEAAQTLINNGCVIISQHADSMGAPTACEEAGVPNVSYNGSMIDACPNTYIISSRINWEPYFEYIIGCVKAGEAIETDYVGTFATNSVKLTELNDNISAMSTQTVLDETKEKLINGDIKVFDTSKFTVEGKMLEDLDINKNYEQDVIYDGYFHESEYQSAPYFDLTIDGITTLNAMY